MKIATTMIVTETNKQNNKDYLISFKKVTIKRN